MRTPPAQRISPEHRPDATPNNLSPPRPAGLTDSEHKLQGHIERLEEQFDQLRQQIRQSQQLASLGTAAALLAHEYNNLMTPAIGYARYALDSDDPQLMRKALEMTLKRGAIVTAMAERIQGLAAHEPQKCAPVTLKAIVEEAVACLARDPAKDGLGIRIDVDDSLRVLADEKQLIQVFFNLLLNARQALLGRGGRIGVKAAALDGDCVEVSVRDTGCGIPAELLDRIFDPFVSTKKNGNGSCKGTGLGLALCHDIVEEHRGTIRVESTEGEGTTFFITLPAAN